MYYIYEITNNYPGNGKTYIGQRKCPSTKTPETDGYMGSGKLIQAAIKKYGIENFSKKILFANIETKAETDELEKLYIADARANGKAEYNIADGGDGGDLRTGKKHTPETRQKMSDSHTGVPLSEEHCRRIGEALQGHSISEETREKLKDAEKDLIWITNGIENRRIHEDEPIPEGWGLGMSEETKERVGEAFKDLIWITDGVSSKRIPKDTPIPEGWKLGRESSPEAIKRRSDAHKGHPAWNKGIPLTKEHRQHMSDSLKGNIPWNKGKKGLIWITDGVSSSQVPKDTPIPEGWVRGMKPSDAKRDLIWINNGETNKRIHEGSPIPEGWVRGMKPLNYSNKN